MDEQDHHHHDYSSSRLLSSCEEGLQQPQPKRRRRRRQKRGGGGGNSSSKSSPPDCGSTNSRSRTCSWASGADEGYGEEQDYRRRYVAMDCEMVGIGDGGNESMLARVTIVSWDEVTVLLDAYVLPTCPIVDYRTSVSGITPDHLEENNAAITIDVCRTMVLELLQDKIVVGHGLKNDFHALGITHPWHDIRDTARYEPFMKKKLFPTKPPRMVPLSDSSVSSSSCSDESDADSDSISSRSSTATGIVTPIEKDVYVPRKLKELCWDYLNHKQIQQHQHSSYEDAVSALQLYKRVRTKWEKIVQYKMMKTAQIMALAATSSSSTPYSQ